jgi:hypothetical protein
MPTQCYTKVQRMVVLSKKGTTWYKSFDTLDQVKSFLSSTKMIKNNLILVEIPSYKEISLDELEKAV